MRFSKMLWCILFLCCIDGVHQASARKIHNTHFHFTLQVPDQMNYIRDSLNDEQGAVYYDTTAGIILMIAARESKFKSVQDYLDCSLQDLEQQLRTNYEDPALKLLSCNHAQHYPEKTTILHFQVSTLPFGYNTYTIYFIHHRSNDIQVSFTYKKENYEKCQSYISDAMSTLKLK